MTHFSLNPIFDGLKPIFAQCKIAVMSVFVLSPVAFSATQSNVVENKPIQIRGINAISQHTNTELNQFIDNMIGLINTINPFIDFTTQIAYEMGALISDQDLIELEQRLKDFNQITQQIKVNMPQSIEKNKIFVEKLMSLSQKMTIFSQVVKSVKYKAISDKVISTRIYQGEESVGYRFNAEHNFDEFKKLILA